jgi:hypothetical protein
MLMLADSTNGGGWFAFVFGALLVGFWAFSGYDILKSRAGWGYTLGIFLVPCLAAILWWTVGKWDKGDPKRAAVARQHKQRLQNTPRPPDKQT